MIFPAVVLHIPVDNPSLAGKPTAPETKTIGEI